MIEREKLKLYAITDSAWTKDTDLVSQVRSALLGGATIVQYREKHLPYDQLKKQASDLLLVCREFKVPLIINDDPHLAKEIDADGVHVGLSDMSVKEARRILGEDKIIGATAKTVEQARDAYAQGADYLGSGAVFGSSTKLDAVPMTRKTLDDICASVPIPVVAIGGIDQTNVLELKGASIAGVAVVKGIFGADDVRTAASHLARLVGGML